MKSKDINFEYIEEFVDYLVEKVEDNDELFATIVCKFNEAKEIIKYLMMFEDIDFENIYLESPDEKGYTDEFCMEFWCNDGVVNFSCDPLKVNGEYENPCGDETYLFDDCSSKIIPLCDGSELYFVNIDDECDCDEECDCKCSKDEDDGFSIRVKCNFDAEEAMKIIDKMETRMLEINKIFKEMNNMKNLLRF